MQLLGPNADSLLGFIFFGLAMAVAFNHLQPTEQSASFEFYAHLLQKCTRKAAWHEGKKAHAHLLGSALNANIFLANMLLNMYLRCGSLNEAHMVFENMPVHNACIWTTLISGYVQNRSNKEALVLFERMQQEGLKPDKVTFVCVLNACDNYIHGKQVHAAILLSGSRINNIVRNAVIDMYVQCGNIDHARQLFLRMRSRDVVSWNIIISGYAHHGDLKEVFSLFNNMQSEGLTPNNVTFVTVLSACGVELLGQGKYFHARIVQFECGLDLFVGSALLNMHSKCGSIGGAMQLFDRMPIRDIVVWNTLFGGYAHYGNVQDMIKLFSQMRQESTKPSIATYLSILGICVHVRALQHGRWLHANTLTDLLWSDTKVGSTLVEFYANCESMEAALQVFNTMHAHDLWSWNVMIAGYCQLGQDEDALMLFGRMQVEAIDPNPVIFATVVSACANLAALEKGKQVHTNILKHNYESDIVVASALVQMYANCGEMEDACRVFDVMQDQDIVSWNAIIRCHACQGDALEAYQLFQKMQQGVANPNSVTLISLLSACRYAQLVDEAFHQLCVMSQYDATQVTAEHYACLTDLLGHVGYFEEAESFVNMTSLELDVMAWTSLLGVCTKQLC